MCSSLALISPQVLSCTFFPSSVSTQGASALLGYCQYPPSTGEYMNLLLDAALAEKNAMGFWAVNCGMNQCSATFFWSPSQKFHDDGHNKDAHTFYISSEICRASPGLTELTITRGFFVAVRCAISRTANICNNLETG